MPSASSPRRIPQRGHKAKHGSLTNFVLSGSKKGRHAKDGGVAAATAKQAAANKASYVLGCNQPPYDRFLAVYAVFSPCCSLYNPRN